MELHVALDGYLLAWMGDDLGLHFGALGLIWVTAWKALGGKWAPLVRQGAPMSYLALLCGREHRFMRFAFWGQKVGRPVAACGGLLHPSRSPIEEDIIDKTIR